MIEEDGGRLRVITESGYLVHARPLLPGEPHWNQTITMGYTSHHATCPQAGEWRRR